MAKRGGLGQRGIDLLISASGAGSVSDKKVSNSESEENKQKAKSTANKGKTAVKTTKAAKTTKGTKTKGSVNQGKSSEQTVQNENTEADNAKKDAVGSAASALQEEITRIDINSDQNGIIKEAGVADAAENSVSQGKPLEVNISKVEPNRNQPRTQFDEDALQELADSVRQYGVISPLVVQKKEDYYEIIAGERRWRAAKLAGLKTVPVIVRDYTPKEVMEISLIENIQRQDLNPIEEARAFRNLMEEYHLKQDEVAERVSKSRAAIANAVRLLNLDERVQDMLVNEMLSTGHARALLAIESADLQYRTAQRVFDEKLSVRETEKLVRKLSEAPKEKRSEQLDSALLAVYADMENQLKSLFGTKVSIASNSRQKGKIEISYYSQDELGRIYDLLKHAMIPQG